jgi:hypothetical protein
MARNRDLGLCKRGDVVRAGNIRALRAHGTSQSLEGHGRQRQARQGTEKLVATSVRRRIVYPSNRL